jgi:bifunctional UDP-N-acetylglucosamine pyrophosphorylase/glucosamine-1-phosphate N-acetyltransferase
VAGCQLLGRTTVGSGATIGPDCLLENADIGAGATIDKGSVIRNASVAAGEALPPLTVRIAS